ncbi:Nif11-like leader peptide family natural product precursor [Thiorhodococcus mannitoliphagus]|uniref:Nif11-like leader peptide family natural product n=1 Tax=Thiorhodococcus mannitoliphagus TaxID=329406 RepID=A0A6P1DQA4_9GAMM|nr:Nif11-like leader peptide family RiPP precursor [Thiorhodococcus mannitoliphagus]NEX19730.1 Nif11-like leader peptide family natural product precursor [Thiorhodococcus mannitoliphagus]
MSSSDAEKFFEKLGADADLLKRVQDAQTVDDITQIGSELGLDFTAEEFTAVGNAPVGEVELTDDELEAVAGGKGLSYSSNAPGCSLAPQTKISSCKLTIHPGCDSLKIDPGTIKR